MKISFHSRSEKRAARISYRLRDGRDVQICHRSTFVAGKDELLKFNPDGSPKDENSKYDLLLSDKLKTEYGMMVKAYTHICNSQLPKTTAEFERVFAQMSGRPQTYPREVRIVDRFREYMNSALSQKRISVKRYLHIGVVASKLERFLFISGVRDLTIEDFSVIYLQAFKQFITEEYRYVNAYPYLYENIKPQNRPRKPLNEATVVSQMRMLHTFFSVLEDQDEIVKSPFRKLQFFRKRCKPAQIP